MNGGLRRARMIGLGVTTTADDGGQCHLIFLAQD